MLQSPVTHNHESRQHERSDPDGKQGDGTHVTNFTSLRIFAMRRIRRILTMRMTRALLFVVAAPPSLTQACKPADVVCVHIM